MKGPAFQPLAPRKAGMPNLLKEGMRPPRFALSRLRRERAGIVRLEKLLGKRRLVLLFASATAFAENDAAGKANRDAHEWFFTATRAAPAFRERDVAVLLVLALSGGDIGLKELPDPPADFHFLLDVGGKVSARYGGAPAFYLIGKDGTVKRAERKPPALNTLFGQIDAMPMRRREMKRNG